jgi:hypothetical protein
MDAAAPRDSHAALATARILEDCEAVARVVAERRASARARLEDELGDDLTELLVDALVRQGRTLEAVPER